MCAVAGIDVARSPQLIWIVAEPPVKPSLAKLAPTSSPSGAPSSVKLALAVTSSTELSACTSKTCIAAVGAGAARSTVRSIVSGSTRNDADASIDPEQPDATTHDTTHTRCMAGRIAIAAPRPTAIDVGNHAR